MGDWFTLTTRGIEWINFHSDKFRRFKELQYLAFDEHREEFSQEDNPHSYTSIFLDKDWCVARGATLREAKRALEALRRAGLLELAGMGSDQDQTEAYSLSDIGKAACDDEALLQERIEGRTPPTAATAANVYITAIQSSVNAANTAPINQGNVTWEFSPSQVRYEELRPLLETLRAEISQTPLDDDDKTEALEATDKLAKHVARPGFEPARIVPYVSLITAVLNGTGPAFKALEQILHGVGLR